MSMPQELEDYINYQYGIIDALNHSLAHVSNDLTISQRIIITDYYGLLHRVNPNTTSLRLHRDQEPAKCTGFNRCIRMKPFSAYHNDMYYTSYGNIIRVNHDLSITVLGVPMINETHGLMTVIPRHIREAYRLYEPEFNDICTTDVLFSCFQDVFIAADMPSPVSYELRASFEDTMSNDSDVWVDKYDVGYRDGIDFVESIM